MPSSLKYEKNLKIKRYIRKKTMKENNELRKKQLTGRKPKDLVSIHTKIQEDISTVKQE